METGVHDVEEARSMLAEGVVPGETQGPAPESHRPGRLFGAGRLMRIANRSLVPFGLFATVLATAMVIVLHLLPGWGGVNPITGMLSDYGPLPDGWVFDTALDVLSLGSLALAAKMAWHGVLRGRTSTGLMIAWCLCLIGIASFTKDGNKADETFRGAMHLYSTAAACVSLPVAALWIGWQHRRDPRWRGFARTCQGLAIISVPCFLPFLISFFAIRWEHAAGPTTVPTGLVERLMGIVDMAILVVLALWGHRAATARKPVLEP